MSVPSVGEFVFNREIRLQSLASRGLAGAALEILTGRFTFYHQREELLRRFSSEPYGQEAKHRRDRVIVSFVESVIRRRLRVGFHAIAHSVADYRSPGERALATEFAAMVDHLCPCPVDPPFVDFSVHSDEDSKEKWARERYPTLFELKLFSNKVELGGVSCFSWDVFKNPRMDKVWRYKFSDNDVVEYPLQLFRHVRLRQARAVYRPEWLTLLKRKLRPIPVFKKIEMFLEGIILTRSFLERPPALQFPP